MTPALTGSGRGNFEINRRFKNVGHVRKSLGTKKPGVFKQRVALLEKLYKMEQYETLRAFKDGTLTIESLVEADRQERLGSKLSDIKLSENLWVAFERTLAKMYPAAIDSKAKRGKAKTVKRYIVSVRALKRKAAKYLPESATVGSFAQVPWDDLLGEWGASKTDWMHMKRAVSKVLSELLGDLYHPFARSIRKQIPNQKPKKRKPNVTPKQFVGIVSRAPEHARLSFWVLAVTGMRVNEYLDCTPANLDHAQRILVVPGSEKNEQGEVPQSISPRLWPRVVEGVPSPLRYKWLNIHWNRACKAAGVSLHMHDLRHCAGQWARQQGARAEDVQSFLRHDNPGQTNDYLLHDASLEVSEAIADAIESATPQRKRRKA